MASRGNELLLCSAGAAADMTDKRSEELLRRRRRHFIRSHAHLENQRVRTNLSLIIVSVILVPIVTHIQPTLSQLDQLIGKSKQQQQQPPTRPTRPSVTQITSQSGANDWAARLRPPSSAGNINKRQDEASAQAQQQTFIESDLAARANRASQQAPLWLRTLNGDQQSPLGRALEATRMFMRQQQQQQHQQAQLFPSSQPRFPLIQSLVAAGRANGDSRSQQLNVSSSSIETNGTTTTAGRLMQFLFQPKSVLLPAQPISRQQQQQAAAPAAARNNTQSEPQEAIQSASSENFYEQTRPRAHESEATGWPHRLLGDGRSLVTLSAPYEQGPRTLNSSLVVMMNRTSRSGDARGSTAGGRQMTNLIASASGSHHLTTSLSYADGSPVEEPTATGDNETSLNDADPSGQEPNQAQEVYYLEQQPPLQPQEQQQQVLVQMTQEEVEQQQRQSQGDNDAGTQWNATSQLFQSSPGDQPPDGAQDQELQDQEGQQQQEQLQQQQQADESSQLPGEEHRRQRPEVEELQMNANGELFEGPGSEVSFGQRPPLVTNETNTAYLQLYEDSHGAADKSASSNKQPSPSDRNRLSNSTTSYLLPVTTTTTTTTNGSDPMSTNLQDEGSLAAAQLLPSQYESLIRAPPEGHYDDYFKPLGSGGDEQARFITASSSAAAADFRAQQQHNETVAVNNSTAQDADSPEYQYFMSQQQMFADQQQRQHRQNPSQAATANSNHRAHKPLVDDANSSHLIQYETQRGSQPERHSEQQDQQPQLYQIVYQQQQQQQNQTSQVSLGAVQQVAVGTQSNSSSGATGGNSTAAAEQQDNIQLIVANSASNLQDPNTHEKVITYTSEAGRNFARPVGKPARHTFYNKDLNESPPATPGPLASTSTATPTSMPARQIVKFRSTRSPEYPTPTQTSRPALAPVSTQRSDELGDEQVPNDEMFALDEAGGDTLPAGQFGQYATSGGQVQRQSGGPSYRAQPAGDHRQRPASEVRGARNHRGMMAADRPHTAQSSNKLVRHPMMSKQRPQVTEARFELKELPLNAPTAMPSVGASTVKSIADLPTKVKRIRDHQVDKNELMNELLTALDRVKAAIYKLQPLTAKMNAMYRKSVTSNTRDQILDTNKGTYSKRYPPGDFDDTYDRMHPSELLEHQQRLSSRGGDERRSARLNRAASGVNSTLAAGRRRNRERGTPTRQDTGDDQDRSDSKTMAVYLPAPLELRGGGQESSTFDNNKTSGQRSGEQIVIASGSGRRVGGKLRGRLSLRSSLGGEIIYDDDDDGDDGDQEDDNLLSLPTNDRAQLSKRMGEGLLITDEGTNSSATGGGGFRELQERINGADDEEPPEDGASPLFGYRITIYQSPGLDGNTAPLNDTQAEEANRILSYSLIGDNGDNDDNEDADRAQQVSVDQESDEPMATSESSVVATPEFDDDQYNDRESSESKRKKVMMMMMAKKGKKSGKEEEEEEKGKKGREKEHKKGNKWSKHEKRGKKGEEEHKKKKEFKKIKHHKGLMSKESHKLHRDKHIKAHDRGAAKEKALKERTQIEFFEREQIVDDEFEKGKKSTMKAGWASGHDAKKSSLEVGGGGSHDSMSMGGSHYVNHLESPPPPPVSGAAGSPAAAASSAQPMLMAASEHGDSGGDLKGKGHGHSSESSSGKQSNKFEKKHMEAKGKKFKGWREKGYKIITETEFIDRGSLHDSAYKKRDKGAAHHQKFKKHEAKSEGHQGSMHEHHKKSHKKEEKKSKMEEKKKELSGKEGEEERAKRRKKQQKEEKKKKEKKKEEEGGGGGDHDQEESAPTMSSLGDTGLVSGANHTSGQAAQATTLRPTILSLVATTTPRPPSSNRTNFHFDGADPASLARHRYVITPSSILNSDDVSASRRSDHSPELQRLDQRKSPLSSSSSLSSSFSLNHQQNATLLDLIQRLNPSQARTRGLEGASSPLLRLVNTLAKLDNQQRQLSAAAATRRQASSISNGSGSKQQVSANGSAQPAAAAAAAAVNQQQQSRLTPQPLDGDQKHRTSQTNQRPAGQNLHQPSSSSPSYKSAFVHQNALPHLSQSQPHYQPADQRLASLPHFSSTNLRPLPTQNSNAIYHQNQQRQQPQPQIYLQPPTSASYLPPIAASYPAASSESSPFSFMATDGPGGQAASPFDALANFDPFDYEQPADSQQQQQQHIYGSLPSQLHAAPQYHHQLHRFNFLTEQR